MNKEKRASIKTVALMAGVSIATVSRALKNPEIVSTHTLERVRKAIRECGYTPNGIAQMMRTRRSGNVVVIFPDITRPFNADIINGIESAAHRLDYFLTLGTTSNQTNRVQSCANLLLSGQADGMILLCPTLPFDIHEEEPLNLQLPPIVNTSERVQNYSIPSVMINNELAAQTAVEYLISLGHRRIAAITGNMSAPTSVDRLNGYKHALTNSGISINENYISYGDYAKNSGCTCSRKLLSLNEPPTAIFCFDDDMAMGAIQTAQSLNISIPYDLSIVGFDDTEFSQYLNPSLTTIRQPRKEMGEQSMQLLYEIISDRQKNKNDIILEFELIVRKSTCPPKL